MPTAADMLEQDAAFMRKRRFKNKKHFYGRVRSASYIICPCHIKASFQLNVCQSNTDPKICEFLQVSMTQASAIETRISLPKSHVDAVVQNIKSCSYC
jgi:hypothetical protein